MTNCIRRYGTFHSRNIYPLRLHSIWSLHRGFNISDTAAKSWLEGQLNGTENIGIPWLVILEFLRIMTHGKVFPHPLTEDQAVEIIDTWLEHPLVRIPHPGQNHWQLMKPKRIRETHTNSFVGTWCNYRKQS